MQKQLPNLFVAVDASSKDKVTKKIKAISNVPGEFGIKLNLDLVFGDIGVIKEMMQLAPGRKFFVDCKMYNGKRTMAELIRQLADYGVVMANIYAHADNMLERAIQVANDNNMTILGVTVLTHHDDKYCRRVYQRSIGESVRMLTEMALENGCHGVILPGTTLGSVSDLNCIKFNPAVRPKWFGDSSANFQCQIMDHRDALKGGATIISCGSPIFKSKDPAKSLKKILEEIKNI